MMAPYHCKFSDLQTEKIVIREMRIFLHQLATMWMSKYKCCMVGNLNLIHTGSRGKGVLILT